MFGSFDEKCLYCGIKVDFYSHFVSHEYNTNFDVQCPDCGEEMEVQVHAVPEFEVFKK